MAEERKPLYCLRKEGCRTIFRHGVGKDRKPEVFFRKEEAKSKRKFLNGTDDEGNEVLRTGWRVSRILQGSK